MLVHRFGLNVRFGFVHQLLCLVIGVSLSGNSFAQQFGQPRSHTNTKRGAVIGGVAGAAIGGVVGNQKDRAGKGALIGGAVGAIAGAVIGNEKDKRVSRQPQPYQYYNHGHGIHHVPPHSAHVQSSQGFYVTPQTFPSGPGSNVTQRPVTVSEVVSMTRSGVSESIIISHIRTNGVVTRPSTNDIVSMAQQGVSNAVIAAMQGDMGQPQFFRDNSGSSLVYPSSGVVPSSSLLVPPRTLPPTDRRGF